MTDALIYSEHTGVIVVDVQADFTELKAGSLAVPGTDAQYISVVQRASERFLQQGLRIYFTQDWHPADHISFYTNHPGTEPLQPQQISCPANLYAIHISKCFAPSIIGRGPFTVIPK